MLCELLLLDLCDFIGLTTFSDQSLYVPHSIRFGLSTGARTGWRGGGEKNKCGENDFFHTTYSPCILCS